MVFSYTITLYLLADFVDEDGTRIRKDENYEKNYLIGKYGAISTLKSIDIFKGEGWPEWDGEIRMAKKDRTGNRKIREQRKQLWYADLTRDKNKSSDDGDENFRNTIKFESGRDISKRFGNCVGQIVE